MSEETINKHFIPGSRLRLSFPSPEDPSQITEINTTISTVKGEVVIVELPNKIVADKLRDVGSFEVTVGAFGANTFCRCLANSGDSTGQSILLYVERVLEMLPQRREDFRLETALPLYVGAPGDLASLVAKWESERQLKRVVPEFKPADPEDEEAPRAFDWKEKEIYEQHMDLSAGGLMYYAAAPPPPGQFLPADVFIPCEPFKAIPVILRVIRSAKVDCTVEPAALVRSVRRTVGGRNLFRVSVAFERIDPRDQEILVAYTVFGKKPKP